jgi:RpiR family carbohydrate utilization transcriptional regulator
MLSQIARAVPDLSRAEKRVASWVLDHPKQATSATLAHIANECGTSEPTVLRFCRRMGMKGFRELGVRVAESLSVPGSYVHRDVNPDDSISDAAIKVMDASIQSLAEMRAQLSSMPIGAAATAMAAARQIAFAGLGASGHVARDACHKFPDDVLVLLSHTGRWQEFAQAADIARERGTTVIAITNPESDLARSASILFPCRVIEDTNVFTPMSSRLGQLALLDALLVALALTHGSAATERLRLSKDALQPRDRSLES